MINSIFCGLLHLTKFGCFSIVGFRKSSRWYWYAGQAKRKWASSSTLWLQSGQMRSLRFIFWCRPTSINNLWLDNLNLVTDFLTEKFFISVRYDSNPFSFLNKAYVLSLLVSFEIFSNASCVKISLSLSESFLKTNRGLSEWSSIYKLRKPFDSSVDLIWLIHGSSSCIA